MARQFGIRDFTFDPPRLLKRARSGQLWEVAEPWDIFWKDASASRTICLPAGFHTDLMTSPLKPAGDETIPSLLHDGLYVQQPDWCPRSYADEAFLALLLACNVPAILARRYFYAVQAFGGFWWDRGRRIGSDLGPGAQPQPQRVFVVTRDAGER